MNVFVGGIFNFQHHLLLSTFGIPWWRDQTHLTHLLPDFRIPTHGFWVFKVCPICWRWSLHDGRAKEARMTISVQYVDCKLKLVWRIPVDVFFPAEEKWLMVSNSFFREKKRLRDVLLEDSLFLGCWSMGWSVRMLWSSIFHPEKNLQLACRKAGQPWWTSKKQHHPVRHM